MKGIVFTEFLEMVEGSYGLETVDYILQNSDLDSNGIYTSVGTYDYKELITLFSALSTKVKITVDDIIYSFGKYFFTSLKNTRPQIFEEHDSPEEFLTSIEDHVYKQVKEGYPPIKPQTFTIEKNDNDQMIFVYKSTTGLYMLALGFVEKTFEHYNPSFKVTYKMLSDKGTQVRFIVMKK